MKKKFIYIIIIAISLALIGLVGIQLYWINTAIKVKEARFMQNINEAVSRVVFRLEKIETAEMMQKQMQLYDQLPNLMPAAKDSSGRFYYRNSYQSSNRYTTDSVYNVSREQLRVGYQNKENGKFIEKIDTNVVRTEKKGLNEPWRKPNPETSSDTLRQTFPQEQNFMQNYIHH